MRKVKVAIIGPGNIGTDLMIKVMRNGKHIEMGAMVGVDPASDGLARAARLGIPTTSDGIEGLLGMPEFPEIDIVFDATSASAHAQHNAILQPLGRQVIDLTPAALGPYVIPAINLDTEQHGNINMVTCGGQATIPIVAAVSQIARVHYAEIVATIASKSAGPGTRANIDEFTETTREALEQVGGAEHAKAIIILNPAEPPVKMRDTIFMLTDSTHFDAIRDSIHAMVESVQRYVPGYRLKQDVQFETVSADNPVRLSQGGTPFISGTKITVLIEVEGAAHYLPAWAGNLDIMTSAACASADHLAEQRIAMGIALGTEEAL
ncbi:acetaldehyde dehydrogenase (acetylating) [Mangrovibacter yixingensis]|uniref:acetaldehyde dehydrogenase (acetylating) n=1 Tax=Mangrovibacter yixingensis TaxID=1529639 RepID=UPI001CF94861|nr:acetaldehyde dehydrogenase (acetylating) [Mangrovibacter yixingensis]